VREGFGRSRSDANGLLKFVPGPRIALFDLAGVEKALVEQLRRKVDLLNPANWGSATIHASASKY
jgi:predicted nucleotidyltransferase